MIKNYPEDLYILFECQNQVSQTNYINTLSDQTAPRGVRPSTICIQQIIVYHIVMKLGWIISEPHQNVPFLEIQRSKNVVRSCIFMYYIEVISVKHQHSNNFLWRNEETWWHFCDNYFQILRVNKFSEPQCLRPVALAVIWHPKVYPQPDKKTIHFHNCY